MAPLFDHQKDYIEILEIEKHLEERRKHLESLKNDSVVSDEERNKRWEICKNCPHLIGTNILGQVDSNEPDENKNCNQEKTRAYWFTQFASAKCPGELW